MSATDQAPPPSPWLSAWLRPRDTISQVLATDPRRSVLLLAALGGISSVVVQLIGDGLSIELFDWRLIAAIVIAGALIGVVGLYVTGFLFRLSGRLLGTRASATQLRAVLAWGEVPSIGALVICVVALGWLKLSDAATSSVLLVALQAIAVLLGLWSVINTFLMLARAYGFGVWRTFASGALGWILATLLLVVPVLLFRTFVFQPFNTPSGSMMPTLLNGDYFFVSKSAYGYTHYSLPFSPRLFAGRVMAAEPQRGDLAVFRLPKDDTTDYIKRVVGLPGDRIQMRGGELYINGTAAKRERVDDFVDERDGRTTRVKRWRETLPNGASYETLDLQDNGLLDDTREYTVPAGEYFVLGDNRDNSTDSRLAQFGTVPFEYLIGRPARIFFSADRGSHPGQSSIRSARLGLAVR